MNAIVEAPAAKKARVEIIPLIDVIFFLLATFVLFMLSMEKFRAIEVQLPVAGKEISEGPVCIQTSESGTFYWKQTIDSPAELFNANELRTRLAIYKNTAKSPAVFIRGDNKADFGAAVLVMDEARGVGIKRISIETITSTSGK